jgi:predicted transcriptional regulator
VVTRWVTRWSRIASIQTGMLLYARTVERPVSRSEMAEVLGVSRSKVSLEVGRLIELGLLVEDGLAESDGGRRSSLLRIRVRLA